MKKVMSMLMVVVLVLAMMTMFAGCGNDADKLVGTWTSEVDMTQIINEELAADPTLAGFFTINDFRIVMIMTFNEDGTYCSTVDAESVTTAMEGLLDDMETGIVAMLQAELDASGLDMSVEDMLAMSGMSMEDLMAEMKIALENEGIVEQVTAEATMEGNYEVKGDKLFLSDGLEYDVDPAIYEVIELDGNTMTWIENVGSDELGLYPIMFTKS